MFRRPIAALLALVLGAGAAGLVACSDSNGLIGSSDAGKIKSDVAAATAAADAGHCQQATRALQNARQDLDALPRTTDRHVVSRLREGLGALSQQARAACAQATTQENLPTVTETAPPTTQTDTTTTETTTTPPTDTTTTQTDTTTTPTDTTPTTTDGSDGTGGMGSGGSGGDGTGGATTTTVP